MILEFKSIKKSFKAHTVLNGLSFNIQDGEYVGLIGNNGSGKTTTIHLALNLIQPQAGSISFFGNMLVPGNNKFRSQTGIVLSEPYYIESFSVKRYLNFVGKFQKIKKDMILKRSADLCELLLVDGWENKKIKDLSSGNKMKVSIIAALLHNPRFLVLDEPFAHLDIETTTMVTNILKKIKETKTMLISSHNLDLVIDLCDRFLVLDNSKIALDIDKKEHSNESLKNKIQSVIVSKNEISNINWLTQ